MTTLIQYMKNNKDIASFESEGKILTKVQS
jgi:hypothetical protein